VLGIAILPDVQPIAEFYDMEEHEVGDTIQIGDRFWMIEQRDSLSVAGRSRDVSKFRRPPRSTASRLQSSWTVRSIPSILQSIGDQKNLTLAPSRKPKKLRHRDELAQAWREVQKLSG
jgi:hypothetical protein